MSRIPIVLLSGFLGSGKTTLLNRLLRDPDFQDTAVVVNEVGAVGVDHALIALSREDVILLDGGCICCALKGSLNETLHRLTRSRLEGGTSFRRVIVETSGLTDPGPVAAALVADPAFMRDYMLAGVTTLVDAIHFDDQRHVHPEVLMQVGFADRLLISKADLSGGEKARHLANELTGLYPSADCRVLASVADEARLIWIDSTGMADRAARISRFQAQDVSAGVVTAALNFSGRLRYDDVNDWLDHTMALFGPDLLRLKGILQVEEAEAPVILHGVAGLIYSPGFLPGEAFENGRNSMVLIARGIERPDLEDALVRLAQIAG